MTGLERIIYVDDSHREQSALIIYGWVECHPVEWRRALREWLEHRKYLRSRYGVRVDKELHGTEFINGRGDVSDDRARLAPTFFDGQGNLLSKQLGQAIAVDSLALLQNCTFIRAGAVWCSVKHGRDFTAEKYALYGRLLAKLERELSSSNTYGLIVMDGEDPNFRAEHRNLKLDQRHIVEDPVMQDSKRSQMVQMADLVAYTAFTHLNRHEGNKFGWEWYNTYLAPRFGLPQEL
ncbi:MAG TPA: DUF3800 domain-containing protein [Candidatus Ruania gallistercoris]|uniref:DUF3800 domain-containing protein n=1 Tax=Candidatus Ruania gallistercoris TaxID=2838746 RepID=A0A9D2J6U5_9MICO|nr:DUF3800 domain-containing protein [Candidatus Ruania gallistercoris]